MKYESFIAWRYLRSKRSQAFISVISAFSLVGVALGVAALIVAMSIMNGFTTELREKILGATAQVMVYNIFEGMYNHVELRETLMDVPGVVNATPFIYTEMAISTPRGVKGVATRGIDPKSGPASISMLDNLDAGSLDNLAPRFDPDGGPPVYGIIIGRELARNLQVEVGSRVNILAPSGRRTAAGVSPRVVPFVVAGLFHTGMIQYDTSLAYVNLEAAASLTGMSDGRVTGMELTVADVFKADQTGQAVQERLGEAYSVRTWMESNVNVFAALKLEKFAIRLVLFLIILVASFTIVASLVMLVMEKKKDIAILMSMGATRKSVERIFIHMGGIIGLVGTVAGSVLGLGLCFALKRYKFIELPEGAYPMQYVPVLINLGDLLIIWVGAFIICALATRYPARKASGLVPSEALRGE